MGCDCRRSWLPRLWLEYGETVAGNEEKRVFRRFCRSVGEKTNWDLFLYVIGVAELLEVNVT